MNFPWKIAQLFRAVISDIEPKFYLLRRALESAMDIDGRSCCRCSSCASWMSLTVDVLRTSSAAETEKRQVGERERPAWVSFAHFCHDQHETSVGFGFGVRKATFHSASSCISEKEWKMCRKKLVRPTRHNGKRWSRSYLMLRMLNFEIQLFIKQTCYVYKAWTSIDGWQFSLWR